MKGDRQDKLPVYIPDAEAVGHERLSHRPIREHPVRFHTGAKRVGDSTPDRLQERRTRQCRIVEHDPIAGHSAQLAERLAPVGCVHQNTQTDDRIEGSILEPEPMRVPLGEDR